jgi:hypothetical protein
MSRRRSSVRVSVKAPPPSQLVEVEPKLEGEEEEEGSDDSDVVEVITATCQLCHKQFEEAELALHMANIHFKAR